MHRDVEWFVEQMGLSAEADGLPRIAGRLFGLLIASDEPRSLDDLAESLKVSKASVSTDARLLLQRGVLQRLSRAGDRRDYYAVAPDYVTRVIENRLARWSAMRALSNEARRRLPKPSAAVRSRLAELEDVHAFLFEHIDRGLSSRKKGVATAARGAANAKSSRAKPKPRSAASTRKR